METNKLNFTSSIHNGPLYTGSCKRRCFRRPELIGGFENCVEHALLQSKSPTQTEKGSQEKEEARDSRSLDRTPSLRPSRPVQTPPSFPGEVDGKRPSLHQRDKKKLSAMDARKPGHSRCRSRNSACCSRSPGAPLPPPRSRACLPASE
ncbi:hypothetical protein MATL_G00073500 [Megalops atlanticus]|uniref:Uncharacterized protein n=1 Tax=Megalops atlanticus TaxID=7932 RepID=A0A9D3T8B0_MEGAT|nr:hypothetical protein MATL_G00073500 [Megalops atlanticus]